MAGLLFKCLKRGDSRWINIELLLRVLFSLPPGFGLDPLALAVAVIRRPQLLDIFPELRSPDVYGEYLPFLGGLVPLADGERLSDDALRAAQHILRRVGGSDD